ncbi:EF-hand domain-containing protein [Nocardia sp. XZ_19_385]|uniref:EF-hand domain-containing protein n=1 Tax=Nocardia sp. XZ_19_385 TaxID=2769488 RepID=UPI001E5EC94F|nr:EF-hand domain-containing protein [Nocardia sp. XZ_19_385]
MSRIRVRFDLLDTDGNGVLGESDFRSLADRIITGLAEPAGSPRAQAVLASHLGYWQGLLAHADANNDGVVSFEEYADSVRDPEAYASYLRPYAESVAAICDRDGDGMVDRAEYLNYMRLVGFDAEKSAAMFDTLDHTGSGEISAALWAEVIGRFYTSPAADPVADLLANA